MKDYAHRGMVKMATGQNGDKSKRQQVKTATNQNGYRSNVNV